MTAPVQVGDHVLFWVSYQGAGGHVGGWQRFHVWGTVKKVNRKTVHILRDRWGTLEIVPIERVLGGHPEGIR